MRKYGLIGYPLGHSFSKKYFTEKFIVENISGCTYDLYPLTDIEQLPELIRGDQSLAGLNVTIPYKEQVLRYLGYCDREAKDVGAVNVIKIKRSAGVITLSGFNSDVAGIRVTLMPFISPMLKDTLVLGTGGSSRAVCYVLREIGVNVKIVSRRPLPGCITYADIDKELMDKTRLIVNTTPLGMHPEVEGKPDINYDLLNSDHILFDLVYNPEQTAFLKSGEERGCQTINGLKMLYAQAERSWEIWNDPDM